MSGGDLSIEIRIVGLGCVCLSWSSVATAPAPGQSLVADVLREIPLDEP